MTHNEFHLLMVAPQWVHNGDGSLPLNLRQADETRGQIKLMATSPCVEDVLAAWSESAMTERAVEELADEEVSALTPIHRGAITRAKLEPFRIYDLRHTFATRATEAGVDIMTLATLLGRSRVRMVMRYAHPTEEHQLNALGKLEIDRAARG
jgi:integrase